MLELHLLRHAKTEQFSSTGRDFDRPLMEKGLRQREDLARFFDTILGIEHVWCSSSKRTRQTFEVLKQLPDATYDDDLYLCSHKKMLEK